MDTSMAPNLQNMSKNIVQAMANIKDSSEFDDFIVEVEGKIFSCHSFVLLSCSEFFRGMLRSNMKEKQDRTVRLSNMTAATFQLILDTLYTGENKLTVDNLIDVWHAVHQLQIAFLMEFCEDFVVAHLCLDNLEIYKRHADYLHSRRASLGILEFIMKNFPTLRQTEVFLNLEMDDLKELVLRDDLVVDSEDLVLQAVFAWASYGDVLAARKLEVGEQLDTSQNSHEAMDDNAMAISDANSTGTAPVPVSTENERKKYLADILQCTRYCAATDSCISKLYQHHLTLNDPRVKDILFRASSFKLDNYMRGFWPSAAIYRDCWGYEHVGVYCNAVTSKFFHLSLKHNTMANATDCPPLSAMKLAVFNDKLFACTSTRGNLEVFTLEKKLWLRVCAFQLGTWDKCMFMLSHGTRIFIFSRKKMRRFDPNAMRIRFQQTGYDISSPQHAMSFHNQILVFSSVDNGGVEETAIHAWSSETEKWSILMNIRFTSTSMTSFEGDTDSYILDPNGHLWKLTDSDTVLFTYLGKLWDLNLKLAGALLFRKSLYVFVDNLASADGLNFNSGPAIGIFQDVKFQNIGAGVSTVVHLVKENKPLTAR